jgi:hypothetical protein
MAPQPRRARPVSQGLLDALRAGKANLRRQRESADLREKVRMVLELQRICLPLIARQRRLAEWERPWGVTP